MLRIARGLALNPAQRWGRRGAGTCWGARGDATADQWGFEAPTLGDAHFLAAGLAADFFFFAIAVGMEGRAETVWIAECIGLRARHPAAALRNPAPSVCWGDGSDRPQASREPCAALGQARCRHVLGRTRRLHCRWIGVCRDRRELQCRRGGDGDRFRYSCGLLLLCNFAGNLETLLKPSDFLFHGNVEADYYSQGRTTPGPAPPPSGTTMFSDPSPLTLGEVASASSLLGRRLGRLLLLRHRGGE